MIYDHAFQHSKTSFLFCAAGGHSLSFYFSRRETCDRVCLQCKQLQEEATRASTVWVANATSAYKRWPESLFQTPTPFLFQNFWTWCEAKFLTSCHVRMHRVIFYISNTMRNWWLGLRVWCLSKCVGLGLEKSPKIFNSQSYSRTTACCENLTSNQNILIYTTNIKNVIARLMSLFWLYFLILSNRITEQYQVRNFVSHRIQVRKFFKFENPTPVQTQANIDRTEIYPRLFLLKKRPRRLLLLQ